MSTVGHRIKVKMQERRISQYKLAKLSGVAQSTISAIIADGQTRSPAVDTVEKLARALSCSVTELMDDFAEKETPTAMGDGLKTKVISRLNDLSSDELQRVDDFLSGLQSARKGH